MNKLFFVDEVILFYQGLWVARNKQVAADTAGSSTVLSAAPAQTDCETTGCTAAIFQNAPVEIRHSPTPRI